MLISVRKLKYRLGHYNTQNKTKSKRRTRLLSFFLAAALCLWGLSVVEARIKPTLTTLTEAYVKNLATRAVNNAIIEKLADEDITYHSLVDVTKNTQGNVTSISTDAVRFNKLKADIALVTLNKLGELRDLRVGIPVGNLCGAQMFAGRGPLIPIRITPAGSVEVEVKNSFTSCGINQTRHEVFLEVKTYLTAVLPTYKVEAAAVTQIPVAETVIVGVVPDSYTSISGSERSAADNAIATQ